MTIAEYLDKLKTLADALAATNHPIDDNHFIGLVLNGLGQEYAPVITSFDNRETPISFDELFGQLLTFELRLQSYSQSLTIDAPTTALLTLRGP